MTFLSTSPEQTKQIAADFARTLKGGEVIFLEGDLGAGKTTFVQGLVSAFSHDAEVRSPTFTLVNVYPIAHDRIKRIVHIDLYRLLNISELPALALEEYLNDQTVVLIEWPELARPLFSSAQPQAVHFEQTDSESRRITFTASS